MIPYPKHYLAEVPQELRLRVLDLCIHRQWHDALDLLHQNAFTQYEWFELVWFHDHAPTELPRVESSSPLSIPNLAPPPTVGRSACPAEASERRQVRSEPLPESSIQQPASEPQTLTPEPNLNAATVKVLKPRGKIVRLPQLIQTNLNTVLADLRVALDPTARLYLQHCKRWVQALNTGGQYLGQQIVSNEKKELTARVRCLCFCPAAIMLAHSWQKGESFSGDGGVPLGSYTRGPVVRRQFSSYYLRILGQWN